MLVFCLIKEIPCKCSTGLQSSEGRLQNQSIVQHWLFPAFASPQCYEEVERGCWLQGSPVGPPPTQLGRGRNTKSNSHPGSGLSSFSWSGVGGIGNLAKTKLLQIPRKVSVTDSISQHPRETFLITHQSPGVTAKGEEGKLHALTYSFREWCMLGLLGIKVHLTGGLLSLLTGMGGAKRSRKAGVTFPGQADLRKLTSGLKLLYHIVGEPIYLQELRCR